jgi:tetratricopeptide (TPR) repeat protein
MTQEPELPIDHYGSCLVAVQEGMAALARSNLEAADLLFNLALQLAQAATREQADSLLPLALCSMSLLLQREGRSEETAKLRERAMPLVDAISVGTQTVPFHNLMSNVLMEFREYRRAIPFCEHAIRLVLERNEPLAIAELLSREGRCYSLCGLKEHAAVLLRAALKILRNYPGDPRLSSVLLSLGNALRKSSPQEAEQLYQESADIHLAKAQMESATTAWVNLGILCSEQGRHAESLAHYERALRVREKSSGTPPVRIATLLNNMANCYRRMGNFEEALRLVDRAIGILKPEDGSMIASAYGTRGQILHDAGQDTEAVEWLRKSYAERQRGSSPDLEAIAENLEREIKSLKRLGRLQDALVAEDRLASMKAALKEAPGASVDLSALTPKGEGAVLIELAFGSRPGDRYQLRDAEIVAEQLAAILESQDAGRYGGRAVIPESTTLMFYGEDAEGMFKVMEQFLLDHCICSGAVVAIRQGAKLREVIIPQTLN